VGGKPVENDRKAPEMGVGYEALGETLRKKKQVFEKGS
jgi:hypothetical protein